MEPIVPTAEPAVFPSVPDDHSVHVVAFAAVAKPSEASAVVRRSFFIEPPKV